MIERPWWVWLFAAALAVLATGRVTRLIVHDHWPPIVAFRRWWIGKARAGPWSLLVECHYCVAVYVAVPVVLVGWWSDLAWWWWLVLAWPGLAYAAAILVSNDGDDSDEDEA